VTHLYSHKAYGSFLLLALLVLPAMRLSAQKVDMKNNTLTTGCYNASQMEIAEELCIFDNHRFIYAMSYGAVDQFSKGVWEQHNDTLYLTSDKQAPKFVVSASNDTTVPSGKMLLLFGFNYQHAPYLIFQFAEHPSMDAIPAPLKERSGGFEALVDQPVYRRLKILHSMYDTAFSDFPVPPDANKLYIIPGDGLGRLQFNREALLISKDVLESVTNKDHRFIFSGKPPEEAGK
jgi:hypothetical protein